MINSYIEDAAANRRLPQALVDSLVDAGLFRILQPRRYGGLELEIRLALQVLEEIAAADGSTGWCLLKGAGSNQMAGYLPEAAAREIWSDPRTIVAGNFNPGKGMALRTPGGYRLTGRWDWGTGSTHSQWLIGAAMVHDAPDGPPLRTPQGGPLIKALVFRSAEAQLFDTWFSHGMKGTGSGDFAVTDLFVPEAYTFDGLFAAPHLDSHLYAIPYAAQAMVAHAPVAIGIARGALAEFTSLANRKSPMLTGGLLRDRESVQQRVGRAVAHIDAARAYVQASVDTAWAEAARGKLSPQVLNGLWLSATHATHTCVAAVDLLYGLAGGSAVFTSSPLQRAFNDIHVAASHFIVNEDKYTLAGKARLQPDPDPGNQGT